MLIGLSNLESAPPLRIVAPGLAEAVLLIGLGLLAGAVATVCHWLVEARIDRAALRA
jgi:biopolymer transport protein ExbB/TolQ